MNYNEIKCGLQVRIIDFNGVHEERPEHWSTNMDEWQGVLVTIADYDGEYVYIEDDEGKWSWTPEDFENRYSLDHNDPNLVYKRHRSEIFVQRIRAEWKEKQAKKKWTIATS